MQELLIHVPRFALVSDLRLSKDEPKPNSTHNFGEILPKMKTRLPEAIKPLMSEVNALVRCLLARCVSHMNKATSLSNHGKKQK